MGSEGYGCVNIDSEDDEEKEDLTLVTRLLRDFDDCLESSKENLDDAGDKADRLRRRASTHPEIVHEMLTPIPQKVEEERGDEVS